MNGSTFKSKLSEKGPIFALLPALLVLVLILVPFGYSIYYSLTDKSLISRDVNFIGFSNYLKYFSSGLFWHNMKVTFSYCFLVLSIEFILGFIIAAALNRDTLLGKILRPFLLFPLMISPIIGTIMWKLMMNPEYSVLNYILSPFGISRGFNWAGTAEYALFSVVLIDVWMFTPFFAVIILAGLKGISPRILEAASVDGLSKWTSFTKITLPFLKPYIIICLVFRFIESIAQFDIIFGLTRGGPGSTTMNFQVEAYTQAFSYYNLGYGSSVMLVMWLIVFIVVNWLIKYWLKAKEQLR
jgi:multiple sugar transport system permease protein